MTATSVPYLAALVSVSEEVRCRCHLKYNYRNYCTNESPDNVTCNLTTKRSNITSLNSENSNKKGITSVSSNMTISTQTATVSLMMQSPSNDSLADESVNSPLKVETNESIVNSLSGSLSYNK